MKQSLSLPEARRMALAAQGFGAPRPPAPGTRQLNLAMARMGTVQIDSVNVFARSHYMPFFSRLGSYDPAALDRLLFARRAPYVETWAHVAAFVPIEDWALFRFRMDDLRAKHATDPDGWFRRHADVVAWVRAELAERGPLRPAEIDHDAKRARRGPWWDWDVVKLALEYLWLFGDVAVAGRRGFERRYALAEQVIPASVLEHPVDRADAIRELVTRAARACGVATASDIADYWRIKDRAAIMRAIAELVDAGELIAVAVEGWCRGSRPAPAWVHRDARLPRSVAAAAILSPFDPVVWFRDRAKRLFDFDYRIEIYTPAPKRRFGYYSLPVLIGDDVVGRVDLKAERASRTLLVQSAWWERSAPPGAADRLAGELRTAAAWQRLEAISISGWGDAVDDLADVMPEARRHEATAVPPPSPPESPLGDAFSSDPASSDPVSSDPVSSDPS